jgi:hypothetical protein
MPTVTAALEYLLDMIAEHLANVHDKCFTNCPTPEGQFGETVENDLWLNRGSYYETALTPSTTSETAPSDSEAESESTEREGSEPTSVEETPPPAYSSVQFAERLPTPFASPTGHGSRVQTRRRPASAMDSADERVSLVTPRISQDTSTRPGPSGSQQISFSGWPILPTVSTKEPNQKSRRRPPIGDAELANAACAALPSNISDGAQKLLYELITRRGHETAVGVSLITISRETGLHRTLLLQYARELENEGRAGFGTGGCWVPKMLPAIP